MDRELFIQQAGAMQNALRSFLLALCNGNKADADDIAQEALVKAYVSIGRYREKGQFKSWVFKIAFNTFLNHKASQRQYDTLEDAACMVGRDSADGVFEHQQLYLALSTLPPRERSAVSLYYLEGYSVKEIAGITDCSVDAVKKQLSRGREKLERIIER